MMIIGEDDPYFRKPGTLFLAMWDPIGGSQLAPQVNVEEFIQQPSGSLWFEIKAPEHAEGVPAGPPYDFIGQVNAWNIDIEGGHALVRVVQPQIFPDYVKYEEVLNALNYGNGKWADLKSWTPLLTPKAIYNGENSWDTVDIKVERVAFDKADIPGGYTKNKLAVASGLEKGYSSLSSGDPSSDAELLVGTLFTLNAAEYREALDYLNGAEYAQALWSITGSLDMLKRAENARVKYDPAVAMNTFGPLARGTVWVVPQGSWGDVDGEAHNVPGFDQDRVSIQGGADYRFTPSFLAGFMLGYLDTDLDFDNGSKVEYDGGQVGGYLKWDIGPWYLNALGGYGWYDGDSHRNVLVLRNPDPFECGCLPTGISSVNNGSFDADAWMLSGELGRRFFFGQASWISPIVGVTYAEGQLGSFTEKAKGSASGSALTVDSDAESIVSDVGFRSALTVNRGANWTTTAEIRVTWLHEFGDTPVKSDHRFAGIPGSVFTVVGTDISEDTAALDLGIALNSLSTTIGVSYQGRFNSEFDDQGVLGRFVWKFGAPPAP
jgi:uncharacterized protein with beta-barrel porin domain